MTFFIMPTTAQTFPSVVKSLGKEPPLASAQRRAGIGQTERAGITSVHGKIAPSALFERFWKCWKSLR
ncbi:hypothetical protein TRIATDRAFT_298796 [Trichoderma atroviride IMI 206040]|uniref:Uncharacterized protein n=1 Tax=Hypocrea atroviridis (strain ATCC 20476 / IMI 206040) TaxID=452589 RepID=G9NQT1_HYPAI|nr:uncharacterized protein TRIATDRAFT_298796 [Trichoderma atroviride IMI 206040]EHK46901.1 hypothetical protein TRIATDRAFT_298796 [Trichoderma atroviride IMI 206040]